MSLECALKILQEKELIKIDLRGAGPSRIIRFPYYTISSKNNELIERIHEEVEKRKDCICSTTRRGHAENKIHTFFDIAETKKIEKWLNDCCEKEETRIICCKEFVAEYINEHTDYHQSSDCNGYLIINEKVRNERIRKKKEEEERAIELFESMI